MTVEFNMDLNKEHETLARIKRVIRWSDEFVLGFVSFTDYNQRDRLLTETVSDLAELVALQIRIDRATPSVFEAITAELTKNSGIADVIIVLDLEKAISHLCETSPVIGRLNHERELFRSAIGKPVFFWMPDFTLDCVARGAPDFWAWRSGVFEFRSDILKPTTSPTKQPDWAIMFSLPFDDKIAELHEMERLLNATAATQHLNTTEDARRTARLLDRIGMLYRSIGKFDDAKQRFEQALGIYTRVGDQQKAAKELMELGILTEEENLPEALRMYEVALENVGTDAFLRANLLQQIAKTSLYLGKVDEAEAYITQGVEESERIGDPRLLAWALFFLGLVQRTRGDDRSAEQTYRRSLEAFERLGDDFSIAAVLNSLGALFRDRGDLETAQTYFSRALELYRRFGDRHGEADTLYNLGTVWQGLGDFRTAEVYFKESHSISQELGNKRDVARSLYRIGYVLQNRNEISDAVRYYAKAAGIASELENPVVTGSIRRHIHDLQKSVGNARLRTIVERAFGADASRKDAVDRKEFLALMSRDEPEP
jgi:tetratricopeptide (TPR) repeat protein